MLPQLLPPLPPPPPPLSLLPPEAAVLLSVALVDVFAWPATAAPRPPRCRRDARKRSRMERRA